MKAVRRNACAKRPHAGQGPHLLARPRHIHHVLHPADDGPHGAARGIESVPHSFFLHRGRSRGAPRRVVRQQAVCAALLRRDRHELGPRASGGGTPRCRKLLDRRTPGVRRRPGRRVFFRLQPGRHFAQKLPAGDAGGQARDIDAFCGTGQTVHCFPQQNGPRRHLVCPRTSQQGPCASLWPARRMGSGERHRPSA